MKLSPIATIIVVSITLIIALLVSILNLYSGSSATKSAVKIFTLPQNPNREHIQHQHRPQNSQADPHSFGLSDTDKFLAYSAEGEESYSNLLQMLRCALYASKISGRKILVYPTSSELGDRQFSLSWLQILNVNSINSKLNPSHRPCLIRGLNYGEPDLTIFEYVYNGTFLNPRNECDENDQDAPWKLRDPSSWSSDCYLLPWSLIPHIAQNVENPIPLITSKPELHFRFPGNESCGKTFLEHEYRFVESGLDSAITSMDDKLILLGGDIMSSCESASGFDLNLPLSFHIESKASLSFSGISRPVLCMHTENANLSLLIQTANDVIRSNDVHHTIIITDLLGLALKQLQSEVIGSIQFGCDDSKFPVCTNNKDIRNAIEEQICTNAEFFVAHQSSFSQRVVYLRDGREGFESRSFIL